MRFLCITFTRYHLLHPEDHIPRDAAVLFAKKLEDVVLAVPEREVHADEGRVRKGQNEGVQLRVVRVALALRGGVELVAGAEKGDLVDDGLVFGRISRCRSRSRRMVVSEKKTAFLVPLRDAQARTPLPWILFRSSLPFTLLLLLLPFPRLPPPPLLLLLPCRRSSPLQELPQPCLGSAALGLESRLERNRPSVGRQRALS